MVESKCYQASRCDEKTKVYTEDNNMLLISKISGK